LPQLPQLNRASGPSFRHWGNATGPVGGQQTPEAQTWPQLPQFFASLAGSTHLPWQQICPAGQQWPWQQPVCGRQAFPQLPQFWESLERSAQVPVAQQKVSPAEHGTHSPCEQNWLGGHPHRLWHAHRPLAHCPEGQTVPQSPQFWGSTRVSIQTPLQQAPGKKPA
jgi:hypothetical protein